MREWQNTSAQLCLWHTACIRNKFTTTTAERLDWPYFDLCCSIWGISHSSWRSQLPPQDHPPSDCSSWYSRSMDTDGSSVLYDQPVYLVSVLRVSPNVFHVLLPISSESGLNSWTCSAACSDTFRAICRTRLHCYRTWLRFQHPAPQSRQDPLPHSRDITILHHTNTSWKRHSTHHLPPRSSSSWTKLNQVLYTTHLQTWKVWKVQIWKLSRN